MVQIRMRLLPIDFSYSRLYHRLFSSLCKEIRRTPVFYCDLAKIRHMIKTHGIEQVLDELKKEGCLSEMATEYFGQMEPELPMVGRELQAKTLVYLMSLRDKEEETVDETAE